MLIRQQKSAPADCPADAPSLALYRQIESSKSVKMTKFPVICPRLMSIIPILIMPEQP